MKKIKQLFLIVAVLLVAMFAAWKTMQAATTHNMGGQSATAAQSGSVVNIQQWQTHTGDIPVYFVHAEEVPIFDLAVLFKAGSAYDGPQFGLASLTSSLLFEGAGNLDAAAIAKRFDDVGANYGGGVSRDRADISLRSLTDEKVLQPALDTFMTVLSQPSFPEEAFDRVKRNTLLGIDYKQQRPELLLGDAFFAAIYGDHPYAHPTSGAKATVEQLTRAEVQEFYKQYYVQANAKIVMVGDVSRSEAEAIAEKVAKHLQPGKAAAAIPVAPKPGATQKDIAYPATQSYLMQGQVAIARDNPDYMTLRVGNYILGGSALESLLMKEVRVKRGLTYSVSSAFSPWQMQGPFYIRSQTRADQATQATDAIASVLKRFIAQGPTEDELAAAKRSIIGGFPVALDSNSAIMGSLENIAFYDLPLNYFDTYRQKVQAVTTDEIKAAFQRHLDAQQLATVTVGPAS